MAAVVQGGSHEADLGCNSMETVPPGEKLRSSMEVQPKASADELSGQEMWSGDKLGLYTD